MSDRGSIKENIEKIKNLPIVGSPPQSVKEEKFLREVCEFEFNNIEEPGLSQQFTVGNTKNKFSFTLLHGGKYHLPRFIARHLENCTTPRWEWKPDGTGRLIKNLVGTTPRFQMKQTFNY